MNTGNTLQRRKVCAVEEFPENMQIFKRFRTVRPPLATTGIRTLVAGLIFVCWLFAPTLSAADQPVNPLRLFDTSSPRATLRSFLGQSRLLEKSYRSYRRSQTAANYRAVQSATIPMRRLFDLREVPPANRLEVGGASFAYLHDILFRLPAIDFETVPGTPGQQSEALPDRWIYPESDIRIVRISEGPRQGDFLFSADTVAQLPEFHQRIVGFPVVRPTEFQNWREEIIRLTGPLFPFGLVDRMPEMLQQPVFGTPAWKIAFTILPVLLVAGLMGLWVWGSRRWCQEDKALRDLAVRLSRPLLLAGLTYLMHRFVILSQLNLAGSFAALENIIFSVILFTSFAWAARLSILLLVELVIRSPSIPEESYDAHLLRLLARVLSFLSIAAIVVFGANEIGVPAMGLVAGLGVGGVAFALAAQSTVENLFGGMSIFADRPFRIGDTIIYGGEIGQVEAIGPRSTRIRGLDNTLTTVPNGDLAKMHVTNFSQRDKSFFHHVLGLRYETTPGQFEWLLEEIRLKLEAHPQVEKAPGMPRVRLIGFGDSSIEIDVRAYFLTADYSEFLRLQEEMLFELMKLVEEAGSGFAFPSTTAYLGRDTGLDAEKARRAETLAGLRTTTTPQDVGDTEYTDIPDTSEDGDENQR